MSTGEIDREAVSTGEWAALAAVMLVAIVARIVGLNASLWYDEVFTLTHFVRLPWGELVTAFSSLNNHMFYSLQAKAAVSLFGESAWSLRLPALIFGLASLPVTWWMAREAAGKNAALLTVLLLALSYHHVWFTQNARGYTGLLFWTTAATVLLVDGLKRPSWRTWIGYGACLAAGMYTHLSAAFFFVAHGVVFAVLAALALWRPTGPAAQTYPGARALSAYGGFAFGGALTLVLHLPLFNQVGHAVGKMSEGSATSTMAEWNNPLRTLQEIVASVDGLGPLAPLALAGGVGLIALGAVLLYRRSPLLTAIYLVQIPLSLILLKALNFRIWPRYFFVDIGFIFLCVSLAALVVASTIGTWLAQQAAARAPAAGPLLAKAPVVAMVVVMAAASLFLLMRNYAYPKQDFAGAVRLIQAQRGPTDVATSTGLAAEPLKSYFEPTWPVVATAGDLEKLLGDGHTVWLVTAFGSHTRKTRADVMSLVDTRFQEVAKLPGTLGDGNVHIYRSRPK